MVTDRAAQTFSAHQPRYGADLIASRGSAEFRVPSKRQIAEVPEPDIALAERLFEILAEGNGRHLGRDA
jgi:hypothetical protein